MDGKQLDNDLFSLRIKDELCDAILDYLYEYLVTEYINFRKEVEDGKQYYDEKFKWELIKDCEGKSPIEQAKLWKKTSLYDVSRNQSVVNYLLNNHAGKYEAILSALCDESESLSMRLKNFNKSMSDLVKGMKIGDNEVSVMANDERTAATILACHNPQKYTFYKMSDVYIGLCNYLGKEPIRQTGEKYPHYLKLIYPLAEMVGHNEELQDIVKAYIGDMSSTNLLIAQDICWIFFKQNKDYLALPPKKNIVNQENEKKMYQNYIELLESNHNLILTGAPGTGKTYLAKHIAAAMIGCEPSDKELNKSGRFDFVQFHPSYDYTDFVEGLRPMQKEGDDGQIGFERKDGVFKAFCEKALYTSDDANFDAAYEKLAEVLSDREQPLQLKTPTGSTFAVSLNSKGNLSLYTGNNMKKNGVLTREDLKSGAVYGKSPYKWWKGYYEGVAAELKNHYGLVVKDEQALLKERQSEYAKPYVFVIDEINRGEISKIFGELFFSIDPGYRGEDGAVRTQYANLQTTPNVFDAALGSDTFGHFFVPRNVYIIGTMNDIDRSVESMDFAMRRRFVWEEVTAEESMDRMLTTSNKKLEDIDKDIIGELRNRMRNLNDAIIGKYGDGGNVARSLHLGPAYQIGASYFLKFADYYAGDKEAAFTKLWNNHIKNVLSEYLRGNTDAERQLEYLKAAYDDDDAHVEKEQGNEQAD